MSTTRVGVDVGGTFTDVILHEASGRATMRKLLSTPPVVRRRGRRGSGRARVAAASAVPSEVVHGTTVATNAVLERLGSPTALVTTNGFRDVLELRRLRVPHMYDLFWRKPDADRRAPAAVRDRRARDGRRDRAPPARRGGGELPRGAAARDGRRVGRDLPPALLRASRARAHPRPDPHGGAAGGDDLAVERDPPRAARVRADRDDGGQRVRAAADVLVHRPDPLRSRRAGARGTPVDHAELGRRHDLRRRARTRRVFALESGPAAGVVAALGIVRRLGIADAIAFDMGGTTAKASLIEDGAIARGREYEAGGSLSAGSRLIRGSGELLRIPTIDIAEVGAGGGSLAWLDAGGGLQVGPRSAGADPGPACYGRGGVEPTVTDAERRARACCPRARSPTARSRCRAGSRQRRSGASPRRSSWSSSRPLQASTGSRTRG